MSPAGTPPAQVAFWDGKFGALTRSADWTRDLEQNIWSANYKDSAATKLFMDEQYEDLRGVLSDLGLAK